MPSKSEKQIFPPPALRASGGRGWATGPFGPGGRQGKTEHMLDKQGHLTLQATRAFMHQHECVFCVCECLYAISCTWRMVRPGQKHCSLYYCLCHHRGALSRTLDRQRRLSNGLLARSVLDCRCTSLSAAVDCHFGIIIIA